MRPIGSGGRDVGHSGVATGRGAFNLSSSISVGMKKTPTDGVSLYWEEGFWQWLSWRLSSFW
ncbi:MULTISPECIES: hypothetical protein [Rummeliibacillus]|jgi:hypothetical protein|uniref:hypothetical protein n=1 Tax=Rummeliibacillus TaxID=648802 RepID=UPI0011B4B92F|nr:MULTISPECIES: hypothetical protein [Rummeliibacillus]MBO2535735.1 hypothetical protein [Rummeliibacillus suwonensis]